MRSRQGRHERGFTTPQVLLKLEQGPHRPGMEPAVVGPAYSL